MLCQATAHLAFTRSKMVEGKGGRLERNKQNAPSRWRWLLTWRALWSGSSWAAAAPGGTCAVAAAPTTAAASPGTSTPAAARLCCLAAVARAPAMQPHRMKCVAAQGALLDHTGLYAP